VNTAAALQIEGLRKSFGPHEVLRGVDLAVAAHEVICLIGASGSGKSTLLRCVNLLERIDAGTIWLDGQEITRPGVNENAVRRHIGIVFQSFNLFPHMTVERNVTLAPVKVLGLSRAEAAAQAAELLDRFGLGEKRADYPDRLSGGQTQRVRFSLAIAGECDLIVLDEPTTAMDVETRQRFWASMKEEAAEGKTLLFATHYLEEADQAADRILVINRGRLLADGTPEDIKKRAGAKRMSFRLANAPESFLLGLPGVVSLETRHDMVHIQTDDSDGTLYGLLDAG